MKIPSLLLLAASYVTHSGLISAYDTPDTPSYTKVSKPNSGLVKGYYPSYHSQDGQSVTEINYELYTDLIFFAVIPEANNTLSFDPALTPSQGAKLAHKFVTECKNNDVRPLVSFGGWGGSRAFSNLTLSEDSRKAFAKELVTFSQKFGFQGMEFDWEFPNGEGIGCNSRNPQDTVNFGLLIKEVRALWPEVSLTAAISINGLIGSSGSVATPEETSLLVHNLDYINLMAYDVFGAWLPVTGPVAPLSGKCAPAGSDQSVETGYQVVVSQGFKPEQIVLGIPGYAKRSRLVSPQLQPTVVNGVTSFMYQNHTAQTPPGGKFDDQPGVDICGAATTWGGSFLVNELISNGWLSKDMKKGKNGYTRYFDDCSGTPFLTNGEYFISYDDKQSTWGKARYAKEKNLAGVYFFDTQGPADSTVRTAHKVLKDN